MTTPRPQVRSEPGAVIVDLFAALGVRQADFEGVVDRTDFGDVVGLEILDFRGQLHGHSPSQTMGENLPRWSYDDEIDAFYLRLTDSAATCQQPTVGTATLDDANRVISLKIPVAL